MKLTYWVASRTEDSAFSIRAGTRKEVKFILKTYYPESLTDYEAPRKVTVEYADALDLLKKALGEGGIDE